MAPIAKPHMTAAAFRDGLRHAGLSIDDVVMLTSSPRRRVEAWARGEEKVPFHWFWVLPLLSTFYNRARALQRAQEAIRVGDQYDPFAENEITVD